MEKLKMTTNNRATTENIFSTKNLVFISLMVAISVILTRFFSFMIGNSIRISLGYIPIMIAGILTGPLGGALTGIASDLLGMVIRAQGGYFPGFTLSFALVGLIPGLIFKHKSLKQKIFTNLLISILIVEIFVALILNTFWLNMILGKGFIALLPSRIIARLIITPLEIFIMNNLFKYKTFKKWEE